MLSVKKILTYFLLFIISLSIVGCITYKEVEMVKVTDINIKDFSTKGVNVEVNMQIKNPNNYKISIVDSDLEIFVKNKRIGSASINNKIILPKKSNEIHKAIISASLKEMASGTMPLLMGVLGGSAIEMQVKGDIKAKAKGLSKKFPVDFKEKVKL